MCAENENRKQTPQERAEFLYKSVRYVTNSAICEFHESHGAYWDYNIRDKIIPCVIILLDSLKAQFYYWDPPLNEKIGEIELLA
jgi:hypothetical protein